MTAQSRYQWPLQRRSVPTHCPRCGSTLIEIDPPVAMIPIGEARCFCCTQWSAELVADDYQRMTPERFKALPTPGRPPGRRGPQHPDGPLVKRLVKLLKLGGWMHAEYLMQRLDVSREVLNNTIWYARQRGSQIESRRDRYRLLGEGAAP